MTTRRSSLPILRLMFGLIRVAPGWYLANVILWTSIWVIPVIPALITRRFFDDLGTAGFNPATDPAPLVVRGRTSPPGPSRDVVPELAGVRPESDPMRQDLRSLLSSGPVLVWKNS